MRFAFFPVLFVCSVCAIASAQRADTLSSLSPVEAEIRVSVSVDAHEVPQNKTVTLTVKVSWNGLLGRFEVARLDVPELTNLELVSSASSNWVGQKDGHPRAVKSYEFVLKPAEIGMAYIDGATINYTDTASGETQHLAANRVEVKVTEPVFERDWSPILWATLAVVLLAGVVLALVTTVRGRKAAEARRRAEAEAQAPLEEVYMQKLKELFDVQSAEIAPAFSALSSHLRRYLSEKLDIAAMGLTTAEIADALKQRGVESRKVAQIEEVLSASDVAKFSGGQTDRSALERSYTLAEDILQQENGVMVNSDPTLPERTE